MGLTMMAQESEGYMMSNEMAPAEVARLGHPKALHPALPGTRNPGSGDMEAGKRATSVNLNKMDVDDSLGTPTR